MNLTSLIGIFIGGGMGAFLRYVLSISAHKSFGHAFPFGTLLVNVLGSLAMGFLWAVLLDFVSANLTLRSFLIVGFLGAFTTFSSFSIETMLLIENGQFMHGFLNVALNVVLCLGATFLGLHLGRAL